MAALGGAHDAAQLGERRGHGKARERPQQAAARRLVAEDTHA